MARLCTLFPFQTTDKIPTMQLETYYAEQADTITFTRQQASRFAKGVAGDFNPIHDVNNKRFCVPGDLLFSVVLHKVGLSQQMHVNFSGMVADNVPLQFDSHNGDKIIVKDEKGKAYLSVERSGETSTDQTLINHLIRRYVEFSGQTFPHILVPLMAQHDVMINPIRPLVIYESMTIDIKRFDISAPELVLASSTLEAEGKRGTVRLGFNLISEGKIVGQGEKRLVLSGLRPYDADKIERLAQDYAIRKESYPTD